jgi:replication factor C small subunit
MQDSKIWTEKYRPSKFEDVCGQKEIVPRIEAFVRQKNLPHILFVGPAGTGKTTLSLVIANTLFGKEKHQNFLELNASDERGIDIIRNKVKDFARTKALAEVPFKLIYLDECDSLTREAQQALRRTMESYSNSCRFILSCNYSSKIIDPIKSRCALFKFKPLANEEIRSVINNIEKSESLKIDEKAKDILIKYAEGDVRQIYNILQSSSVMSKNITESLILEIAKSSEPIELLEAIELAVNGDFIKSRKKLIETALNHGLSGIDIIKQLQKYVWELKISDDKKLALIDKCGEIEYRLVEGSDEFVQLESLLAHFTLLGKK